MKKTFAIIALLALGMQMFAQGKEKAYKNVFSFNPIYFTTSTFMMGYEGFIQPNKSLAFYAGAIYDQDYKEGFTGEFQYRYFISDQDIWQKDNLKIFFAPYLQYKYVEITDNWWVNGNIIEDYKYTIHAYGGGILFGFKLTVIERLVFDAYVGGGIRRTNDYKEDNIENYYYDDGLTDPGYNGIAPKAGVTVGFNF